LKIFLITPPFVQVNTPYPATLALAGYLRQKEYEVEQFDWSLETNLSIFTSDFLTTVFSVIDAKEFTINKQIDKTIQHKDQYIQLVESIVAFLQGKNSTLAHNIIKKEYLPKGNRYHQLKESIKLLDYNSIYDSAKYLATIFLEEICDLIQYLVDPNFGMSRYAEKVVNENQSFNDFESLLKQNHTVVERIALQKLDERIKHFEPDIVAFTIPFAGNLFFAFRGAERIKINFPSIKIIAGGGFVNTSMREISNPNIFHYFDFICLDHGETGILPLLDFMQGKVNESSLYKTFFKDINGNVHFAHNNNISLVKHINTGIYDYNGIHLDQYFSMIEMLNPVIRLWNDGRWNKFVLAHGCYWAKCSFCDTQLDYIQRYDSGMANDVVDKISAIIHQTKENGFHFVDEAAPPALIRSVCNELIRRNIKITWWTNIRFEKSFDLSLCQLMSKAGCIAVSGGLEAAHDKLLKTINKGIDIQQATIVLNNFRKCHIKSHAYLIFGIPNQTEQQLIDSLEIVRQLFAEGILQSAFWHKYTITRYCSDFINPESKGICINKDLVISDFINNDVEHSDQLNLDYDRFAFGLRKSVLNFMHKIGLQEPLYYWFDFEIQRPNFKKNYIKDILKVSQ